MPGFDDITGLSGSLCLDFANTVDWRATDRANERLQTYADLLHWAEETGAVPSDALPFMSARLRRDPADAERVLSRARALREGIYGVCVALAHERRPVEADLDLISGELALLLPATRLAPAEATIDVAWGGAGDSLDRPLWQVAWSLIDLLRGPERSQIRECANRDCHWLFLDKSRNRSRRWCAMWNCGNRAKARRYQVRHRS